MKKTFYLYYLIQQLPQKSNGSAQGWITPNGTDSQQPSLPPPSWPLLPKLAPICTLPCRCRSDLYRLIVLASCWWWWTSLFASFHHIPHFCPGHRTPSQHNPSSFRRLFTQAKTSGVVAKYMKRWHHYRTAWNPISYGANTFYTFTTQFTLFVWQIFIFHSV